MVGVAEYTKIYFDLDGVLADFFGGVETLAGYHVDEDNKTSDDRDDEVWDAVNAVPHFNARLAPNPDAVELFDKLSEMYPDTCEVLSAMPKHSGDAEAIEADKRAWCREHLGDDVIVHIVYGGEKPAYCADGECVLIDDSQKNIRAWREAGGVGILYTMADGVLRQLGLE